MFLVNFFIMNDTNIIHNDLWQDLIPIIAMSFRN